MANSLSYFTSCRMRIQMRSRRSRVPREIFFSPPALPSPPEPWPRLQTSPQSRCPDRMRPPVTPHRNRLLLGLAAVVCALTPALSLSFVSPSSAASIPRAPASSETSGVTSSDPSTETSGVTSSETSGDTPGDMELDALMLATPLPGLINFTLVGPGATNGPLTAQTLGSYSSDPNQVEHLFDQYSSESGFAGWIKTWQDSAGTSLVVEIAIQF